GLGVVLGQVRTADKSNEITAIPELLDALLLKGAIVTIDAMGCQQAIARQLVTSGADYVLAVKENQPTLLVEVRTTLEAIDRLASDDRWDCSSEYREVEKDHGRIETRRCLVSDVMNTWRAAALWPGMRSIAMVEATREIGETVSVERRYYVSSLPADATRIAHAVRSHWRIENSMHWVLDVAFGEDQCRVRVEHAAQNFAILRRITMNLLRKDTQTKAGLKIRRLKAATSDNYRAQLLGW
ncbi:ISAs1 family transposase, partial [Burkholderia cepacia]